MKPLSALPLLLSLPALTSAATLTRITTPFGPNPRNVTFNLYVPDTLPSNPAILVNPHWCHGTAQDAYAGSQWATLASKHGFIVIYPGSPNAADQCWDVSSKETLTHDGGGDSLGIVSMVRWTLDKYNGDKKRVFVTGVSSGGMMTQVLLGAYPDVFAAGASFAGVPFGCFAPANNAGQYGYWNGECATGKVTHDKKAWGDIVRGGFPGYDGWRPKVQIYHGTKDDVVSYVNYQEAIKMWTNVLGLSETPTKVEQNTPSSGWTKSVYGPSGWFEAYSAEGVTHNIQNQEATVLAFFKLDCSSGCFSWGQGNSGSEPSSTSVTLTNPSSTVSKTTSVAPISTTSTTKTSSTKASTTFATTTSAPAAGQTLYGQCAGSGYSGPTACAVGGCTTYNEWYGQCVPTSTP